MSRSFRPLDAGGVLAARGLPPSDCGRGASTLHPRIKHRNQFIYPRRKRVKRDGERVNLFCHVIYWRDSALQFSLLSMKPRRFRLKYRHPRIKWDGQALLASFYPLVVAFYALDTPFYSLGTAFYPRDGAFYAVVAALEARDAPFYPLAA